MGASEDSRFCNDTSVKGRQWAVPGKQDKVMALEGLPVEVAQVMENRGVTNAEEFLNPSFHGSMPDPYVLKGMAEAVERFVEALQKQEPIAFFGDYDVDGATSTAILVRHLRMLTGQEARFYIPDRITEGYGPNAGAMETLANQGTRLLVVLDSGTTAFAPIERAVELGMEVIVIDHHKAETRLPPATVINPKRTDEDGSLAYLCTAGLAFLFAVAVQRELRNRGFFEGRSEPDLRELLGIVALGTVADMVPLVGLNRAYVKIGLPMMEQIPGIQALREQTGLEPPFYTVYSCGFVYGPCINAGGRIGDTMTGARLLSTDDPDEASELAKKLHELNKERQEMQRRAVDQAMERCAGEASANKVTIVYDDIWHPGIVGLVASRLKDALDASTIVIGTGGKGSARAVDGFDIGQAIIDARLQGLLIAGGGHAAAGGLTVDPEKIPQLQAFMDSVAEGFVHPPTRVDLILPCGKPDVATVEAMEALAPFGLGNPSPRLVITGGVLTKVLVLKGRHLKGFLSGPEGEAQFILFNGVESQLGKKLLAAQGHRVDLCGKAKLNEYGGKVSVQLHPEDAMIGEAVDHVAAEAA